MPNRIIKESICRSDTINGLTAEEEVFFYRLLVQCDDYGRFDARLEILRAACYPLRVEKVTVKSLKVWLERLVRAQLVWLYEVDGKQYVQITTWERHQQIRAKRSRFPEPLASATHLQSSASICNHVLADAPVASTAPDSICNQVQAGLQSSASICNQVDAYVPVIRIQSESESESESESNIARRKRAPSTPPPPAVKAYREMMARYPPRSWYADIAEAVGDEAENLTQWQSVCKAWAGHGYNPQNVEGMLDCFKRGEVPGHGPHNDGGEPKGWAGIREAERMLREKDEQ